MGCIVRCSSVFFFFFPFYCSKDVNTVLDTSLNICTLKPMQPENPNFENFQTMINRIRMSKHAFYKFEEFYLLKDSYSHNLTSLSNNGM